MTVLLIEFAPVRVLPRLNGVADVTPQIGPIDEEHERCVLTAIGALRAAIVDAHVKAIA